MLCGVTVLVCPAMFFWTLFILVYLADVIASVFGQHCCIWQMLLQCCHIVVDVVPPGQML